MKRALVGRMRGSLLPLPQPDKVAAVYASLKPAEWQQGTTRPEITGAGGGARHEVSDL